MLFNKCKLKSKIFEKCQLSKVTYANEKLDVLPFT